MLFSQELTHHEFLFDVRPWKLLQHQDYLPLFKRAQGSVVGSTRLQPREGVAVVENKEHPECKVGAYLIIIERVNLLIKIIFHAVSAAGMRQTAVRPLHKIGAQRGTGRKFFFFSIFTRPLNQSLVKYIFLFSSMLHT